MNAKHVIMTSDERDEAWWDLVKAQGWYRIDHSSTAEQYGRWFVLPFSPLPLLEPHLRMSGIPSLSTLLSNPRVWDSLAMICLPSPFSLVAEWRIGNEVLPGPRNGVSRVPMTTEPLVSIFYLLWFSSWFYLDR